MRRLSTEYPYTCVTCEAEIRGRAIFHLGLPFCCSGCAADGPCNCSYDEETPEPADRIEVRAPAGRRVDTVLSVE